MQTDIEWERFEYKLPSGAKVERIREIVKNNNGYFNEK